MKCFDFHPRLQCLGNYLPPTLIEIVNTFLGFELIHSSYRLLNNEYIAGIVNDDIYTYQNFTILRNGEPLLTDVYYLEHHVEHVEKHWIHVPYLLLNTTTNAKIRLPSDALVCKQRVFYVQSNTLYEYRIAKKASQNMLENVSHISCVGDQLTVHFTGGVSRLLGGVATMRGKFIALYAWRNVTYGIARTCLIDEKGSQLVKFRNNPINVRAYSVGDGVLFISTSNSWCYVVNLETRTVQRFQDSKTYHAANNDRLYATMGQEVFIYT